MSNWYSLPDSELMVDTWGDKNGASCQYSSGSSNLQSAVPEVASLYLIALHGFLPRIYLAVLWPLETFWACCYYWLVENPFKWEVCVGCPVRRTSKLAATALVAAFLINVNWELVHGFKPSLCPCREGIFAGAIWNSVDDCMWLQGRKYGLQ